MDFSLRLGRAMGRLLVVVCALPKAGGEMVVLEWQTLCPRPYRWLLTLRLQYLAVVEPAGARTLG